MMKRRDFLTFSAASVLSSALPSSRALAAPEDYTGRFFVTLQADGAWDVASFCDPKVNQAGQAPITEWSNRTGQTIQQAGNISYAPYAQNAAFFDKYHRDMLVINGIDAQTNSHTTGVLHNWSGRNSVGYPSLTALFASQYAPELPLSYLNFGGYAETARLIRYTRLDNSASLPKVLTPNEVVWDGQRLQYLTDARMAAVMTAQQQRMTRLAQDDTLLPRQRFALEAQAAARANTSGLTDFAQELAGIDVTHETVTVAGTESNLFTQVQTTLLAFKSGAACSADLHQRGFDTHSNHDAQHEPLLAHFTQAIDYFWTYAEELGIADRITLLIASDFSRTPFYNSTQGKDHWPIGSAIVMEKGAGWTNRVVGSTDTAQNAIAINPTTLEADGSNEATIIYPKHLHKALRLHLGLTLNSTLFPFSNTEDLALFSV